METKKIKLENCRPENRKTKVTQSDVSLKKKNGNKVTVKLSNEKSIKTQASGSKIFSIYEKRKMIEPLRNELLARGWSEKILEDSSPSLPKFVWLARSNNVVIDGSPIVNRLTMEPLRNFCYKDVLIDYGREAMSNKKIVLNMPRTYKLFSNERKEFIENYRLTAYSSFIRYLHATGHKTFSEEGTINSTWIDFAIEKLESKIATDDKKKSESKIGSLELKAAQRNDDHEFEKFKKVYQSVVKYKSKINATGTDTKKLLHECNVIYRKCKKTWKDFEKDGFYNLWLLKPARRSLGIGIKLFDEDFDILSYAKDNANMKYLVQKYVGEWLNVLTLTTICGEANPN